MFVKYKLILLFSVSILLDEVIYGQSTTFESSTDGNYVALIRQSDGMQSKSEITIESTKDNWSKFLKNITNRTFKFSTNSKSVLYLLKDTLFLSTLRSDQTEYFTKISSFKQQVGNNDHGWIGYTVLGPDKQLVIYCPLSKEKMQFNNVTDYVFDNEGKGVLIFQKTLNNNDAVFSMIWIDLVTMQNYDFWSSKDMSDKTSFVTSFIFSEMQNLIAFSLHSNLQGNSLWYYRIGREKAEILLNNTKSEIDNNLQIDSLPLLGFNKKNDKIIFLLKAPPLPAPDPKIIEATSNLDLWSYTDPVIMSFQTLFVNERRQFAMAIDINKLVVTRLEYPNEIISGSIGADGDLHKRGTRFNSTSPNLLKNNSIDRKNDKVIVLRWDGDITSSVPNIGYLTCEWKWSNANRMSASIESIQDGSRKVLKENMRRSYRGEPLFQFSPDGQYVLYYDEDFKGYFSYEVNTGIARNISTQIPVSLLVAQSSHHSADGVVLQAPMGIRGWITDSCMVLISDCYTDIWSVDLKGRRTPINITKSYCRKNHISIRPLSYEDRNKNYSSNDKLLYAADDNNSVEKGILIITLNSSKLPDRVMNKFQTEYTKCANERMLLISRKVVIKQTPQNLVSTKYFVTEDLRVLRPLPAFNESAIRAEEVNVEIISWITFDGKTAFGALYKPNGFDHRKKYPVLFNYYEGANLTLPKDRKSLISLDGEGLNYATALERGYLVFNPDIHYSNATKTSLECAYNYVVSAAKFLSKLPFVEANAMGLTGFSFGGFETNYIVTHSTMFAAAFSSSGASDFVSLFGTEEKDSQGFPLTEAGGQASLIGNIWNNRNSIIDNSSVFNANKVKTPILLSAGANDFRVPYSQAIEFFKALRRLGKKAWLLSYPLAGHGYPDDAEIRSMQFFDHYLKGAPAPVWMTRGIPAKLKGTTLGLEYDTFIKTPGPGLLLEK